MRRMLLCLLCLIGTVTATSARVLYVATNGDDVNAANNCNAATNITTPVRNPQTGANCLGPGDTLYIRAGTYNVGSWSGLPSGTSSQRVTIAGYRQDGERQAVLTFSGGGNGLNLGGGVEWLTFDNLVFQGSGLTAAVIKLTFAQHIRISNSEVFGGGTQGILLVHDNPNDRSRFNEFVKLIVHDNGHSSLDHGLYLADMDNTVDGCEIYGHTGFGIHNYIEPPQDTQTNNIARNNYVHDNGYGILMSNGSNQKAYNNIVVNNNNWGFQWYGAAGAVMVNNTVYGNGQEAFNGSGGTICNNIALQNGNNSASGGSTVSNNITSGSVSFVNAGADNFRLTSSATNAINQGTSGCGVSGLVTTDADGNSRPVNGAWDIGAYEFGGSGGGPTCPSGCTCTITPGQCDPPPPTCPSGCTCTTPGVCDVTPPAPGLQAYWRFDHSSGTTATDATPNGHTMTFTGGPSWVAGRVGSNAIEFTNATQVGMASAFDFTATYSWAGWFKMRTAPRTDVFEICLRYGGGAGDQFEWVWSSPVANGSQAATHRNSAGAYQRARLTTPLQANIWYHVAATWNGTTLISYLNGAQQASTAVSGMNAGGDNTFQLSIPDEACPGAIDDLRLYNTVLTPAEVQTLAGTQAPAAGLVRSHRALMR